MVVNLNLNIMFLVKLFIREGNENKKIEFFIDF